jgi:hypothetical protein
MLVKCNDTGGLDDLLPEPEAPSAGEPGTSPSSHDAVSGATEERSSLAGVPSVGEAGIPPSSEGDKER